MCINIIIIIISLMRRTVLCSFGLLSGCGYLSRHRVNVRRALCHSELGISSYKLYTMAMRIEFSQCKTLHVPRASKQCCINYEILFAIKTNVELDGFFSSVNRV